MGSPKARVFPEPVWAAPTMSRFSVMATPRQRCWISVGSENLRYCSASRSLGWSPNPAHLDMSMSGFSPKGAFLAEVVRDANLFSSSASPKSPLAAESPSWTSAWSFFSVLLFWALSLVFVFSSSLFFCSFFSFFLSAFFLLSAFFFSAFLSSTFLSSEVCSGSSFCLLLLVLLSLGWFCFPVPF